MDIEKQLLENGYLPYYKIDNRIGYMKGSGDKKITIETRGDELDIIWIYDWRCNEFTSQSFSEFIK